MAGIEQRLKALEELAKPGPAEGRSQDPAERERRRAAFLEIVEGMARPEEQQPQRRRALDQLLESMRRRASMRRQARES